MSDAMHIIRSFITSPLDENMTGNSEEQPSGASMNGCLAPARLDSPHWIEAEHCDYSVTA